MKNPLVSIIIPVYNGSNYLSEAIESALNQTYKNIEVIVVNDGSNDDGKTDKIVRSYIPRITYIEKPNGGVGSAINMGIRQMKGAYASWLSHDDLYYPNKVERQVSLLNEIIELEGAFNDVIYSSTETINSKGDTILKKHSLNAKIQNAEIVFSHFSDFILCGCATLIPKQLFEEIGYFDESLVTVQDTEFWCRVLLSGHKYYFQDEYLVKNRRHAGQTSRTLSTKWNKEIIQYRRVLINKILNNSELSSNLSVWKGIGKETFIKCPQEVQDYYLEVISTSPTLSKYYFKVKICVISWKLQRMIRNSLKSLYNRYIAK